MAKSMKPEKKGTLLEIAEAWDRCAEEAEREAGKDQDKKGEIDRQVDGI